MSAESARPVRPPPWRRIAIAMTAGVVLTGAWIWVARNARKYNVVIICLDTVRHDAFFLRERSHLPDTFSPWLARGLNFSNTQSAAPWTVPSVSTFMTGLYPEHHGAGQFRQTVANLDEREFSGLARGVGTIASALSGRGWKTAAFHDNPAIEIANGVMSGFETVQRVRSRELPDRARTWLTRDARTAERFLLYLHFMEAHDEHMDHDPARIAERAASLDATLAKAVIAGAPRRRCVHSDSANCLRYLTYYAAIDRQRAAVAGILEDLRRNGQLEHTIVVLFADHGEEFGEHARAEHLLAADPRRIFGIGHGHSLYQELLHVPLVVWHPRLRGQAIDAPVSLADVAPTLAEWSGVALSKKADGVSLADVDHLRSRKDLSDRIRYSTGIAYGPQQHAGVRGSVKRIERTSPRSSLEFDLTADPGELSPRAPSNSEPLLRAIVKFAAMRPLGEPVWPVFTDSQRQDLQAIGYLRGPTPGLDAPATAPAETRLWAEPSTELDCDQDGLATAVVNWQAPNAESVELRWNAPAGPKAKAWTGGATAGHLQTGHWVQHEQHLYLMDTSTDLEEPKVLATLQFHCRTIGGKPTPAPAKAKSDKQGAASPSGR